MDTPQNQGSGWLLLALALGVGYLALKGDDGPRRNPDAEINPLFGLFGGGGDDGPKRGEHGYTATALHKRDEDEDVHPAHTFYARNMTEAREKVRKWLRGSGRRPGDFKIELERD